MGKAMEKVVDAMAMKTLCSGCCMRPNSRYHQRCVASNFIIGKDYNCSKAKEESAQYRENGSILNAGCASMLVLAAPTSGLRGMESIFNICHQMVTSLTKKGKTYLLQDQKQFETALYCSSEELVFTI